ncbi:protein kinase [Kribbella sp. NBC_00382]|uniref:protein kinase domain-containing protein n=1 Tax=Kribbella sp. NBC_00382 TaxID=2975967 RepID=UPI002E1EC5D0
MASEDISGYSLRRGLGSGSAGTVWLLRDLATGRHAVLKRIPKSAAVATNEFLGDLELARGIDHPHLARLLEVRESDREWLLFSQYVAAGTLTSLLERRGALSPGELVTLISPLAQALSALHGRGLTHGHLDLNDIMFDADGRPVITDAGLRALSSPTTPQADLSALGAIAHQAGGTAKTFPPSLFTTTPEVLAQQALHRATPLPISLNFTQDPEPATKTSPVTPATTPAPATPASPVAPAISLRRSQPPTQQRGSIRETALKFLRTKRAAYGILAACGAGAVTTLVIGLLTVGVLGHPAPNSTANAAQPTQPTTPHQSTTPRQPVTPKQPAADGKKWLQTLQALDVRRSQAFATLDPTVLNSVYVPGSSPWSADRELLATYRKQQLRIEGLRLQIQSVTVENPGPTTVVLRVVDRFVAGAAITSTGQRTIFPPGKPTTRRVTLTAAATSWRISSIAEA